MRILITGGTGLIGRSLCKALLDQGDDLTVLSRQPESVKTKCGVTVKAMHSLAEWLPDMYFDAVINLAGEPIIDKPWTAQRKKRLWDSRVTLTEALVAHMTTVKHKPKVLLSCSATGFYGDRGDLVLDESVKAADDFGAALCRAWEGAAWKAADLGVRVCLLRTGLVLAEGGGLLGKMLLPFKLGLGSRIGNGQQWMSWIHIDDYVAGVLQLLANPDAVGAFNMTAPLPVTNAEFTHTFARALHRSAFLVAPAWAMQLALGQRAYLLLGGQRALPTKLKALGYQFVYKNLEDALRSGVL